jgi:uncharacterized protein
MKKPDFNSARDFALELLETELPDWLTYHSISHTRDGVVPAVERIAKLEGIQGEDLMLLKTAAYFHDLGHIEGPQDHEITSIRIAEENLPRFNYTPDQIRRIAALILATRMPQTPSSHLGEILADADLEVLGRADYPERNLDLRHELANAGITYTDLEWFRAEIELLANHRYFTKSARSLRDAGKQRNLEAVERLLNQLKKERHVDLE